MRNGKSKAMEKKRKPLSNQCSSQLDVFTVPEYSVSEKTLGTTHWGKGLGLEKEMWQPTA